MNFITKGGLVIRSSSALQREKLPSESETQSAQHVELRAARDCDVEDGYGISASPESQAKTCSASCAKGKACSSPPLRVATRCESGIDLRLLTP